MATKTKKQTVDLSQKIISAYMDHVLTENKQPVSVYAFALKAGITEKEFYNYFASFTDIDQKIWDQAGEQTSVPWLRPRNSRLTLPGRKFSDFFIRFRRC
jgi:hypothetical protein